MEIDKKDYSWFWVHYKSFVKESKILIAGIVKNFKRVMWHSKSDLAIEYMQIIGILVFMSVFCYLISLLVLGI